MTDALTVADFERIARARLPGPIWDYMAGGAADEITLRENRDAFARVALHYRVLVDVSRRTARARVLGHDVSMPVLIAPTALHKLAHPEGELATVRAAGAAGTVMIASVLSSTPIEQVTAAATGAVWMQLSIYRDRGITAELMSRAEAAGCTALVVTVDVPQMGRRERDKRNRFAVPDGIAASNFARGGLGDAPGEGDDSSVAAYSDAILDPSLTWEGVDWLRERTALPVLIKGVVRADDAVRAVERGAAGVVVSNHGGRQLDTAPATLDVLPAIAQAVGDRAEVLVDGGVRRGTDVVAALALGARAVLLGRPVLWGLAADGERGVARVLEIVAAELDLAMALCGCPTVGDIDRGLIQP